MFSKELEMVISLAYKKARSHRHKFMTVDDLAVALLDIVEVSDGLRRCGVDLEQFLRDMKQSMEASAELLDADSPHDTQPTLEFQRALQRAVYHAQSSDRRQVIGVGVMTAIFGEKESHTVYHLKKQGVDRLTWINNINLRGADPDVESSRDIIKGKGAEAVRIESSVSSNYLAQGVSGGANPIAELEARVAMLEKRMAELEKKLP